MIAQRAAVKKSTVIDTFSLWTVDIHFFRMNGIRFEWTPAKAAANLRKHGVIEDGDVIRLISARKADPGERAQ